MKRLFSSILTLLLLSFPLGVSAQSVTSSALGGTVYDEDGNTVANVSVRATHDPSGSTFTTETNSDGRYKILGMRVGGPYSIYFSAPNGDDASKSNISLQLQQERNVDVRLRSSSQIFELEEFEVVSNDLSTTFNENKQGSGSVISSADLNRLPTVSRSLNDIVRLDPRMSVYDRDNGTISAGGKNFRYNTLLIDGVPTNDSFGLSDSGLPALKQPFSLESISEISVQLSPYTVENAGFTGAAVSAITKSGTNTFKGSIFGFYRNTEMVGSLRDIYLEVDQTEKDIVPFQDFTEYTAGFTVGGPIIKNKLFFFFLYETVEETIVSDPGDFYPIEKDLNDLLNAIENTYAFDAGTLDNPGSQPKTDDKYLIKLDWNISSKHRLSARYQLTDGSEPNFPGYSGDFQIAFSSHFYTQKFVLKDYTTEIFSNWSSTFQTEFLASFKQYTQERETPDPQLPSIEIGSVNGTNGEVGSVYLGTHISSQANSLNVDTTVLRFKATWLLGDHQIKSGFQLESFDNNNVYIPGLYGNWFFRNGISSFVNAVNPGNVETYSITLPTEGQTGTADWSMSIASAYLSDNWLVSQKLTITAGIRIDYPIMSQSPPQARGAVDADDRTFAEIFGNVNTSTIDGNYLVQPRLGFNYAVDEDRKVQVRGGGGLFFGTAPHVWISSIFTNNGNTQEFFRASTGDTPAFSPDPYNPPVPRAVNSRVNVDFLDEDFTMPSEWKSNLAIDIKLPYAMAFTMEYAASWTKSDIRYIHENLKQEPIGFLGTGGFLPDGRIVYDNQEARNRENGYRDVIRLANTDKGYGRQFTIKIKREVRENWGFQFGYTRSLSRSVNDGQSATASTNWSNNVGFNPNDEVLGRSRYETTHRFVGSATYEIKWSEKQKTSFTLVYDGRSGRPFSYVYGRDGFSIDINRDGNSSNDLIYVPTGVDDPLVRWGDDSNSGKDTVGAAFMDFVDGNPDLANYKGNVVARNSGTSPWIHQFDLNITHEIKTWNGQKLELIFAIENLGNLINNSWGLERRVRNSGNVPIIQGNKTVKRIDGEWKSFYVYEPKIDELDDDNWYETRNFSSRWAMQVGLRYSF